MIPAERNSTIQSGTGITPSAPWVRSERADLAVGRLVEPLAVRRLLGRCLRLDALQRLEHRDAPRVDQVRGVAGAHLRPLAVRRRCGRNRRAHPTAAARAAAGRSCAVWNCWATTCRLVLGAGARGVVALEGEEDDEPEHHGEPGRDHAEHAGCAVAVLEVAALGRRPADEQHRADRHGAGQDHDQAGPEKAHVVTARSRHRQCEPIGSTRHRVGAIVSAHARPLGNPHRVVADRHRRRHRPLDRDLRRLLEHHDGTRRGDDRLLDRVPDRELPRAARVDPPAVGGARRPAGTRLDDRLVDHRQPDRLRHLDSRGECVPRRDRRDLDLDRRRRLDRPPHDSRPPPRRRRAARARAALTVVERR